MNIYISLKKQISIGLIALLIFSLATQPVFAKETTKKNALEYYELDGKQYGYERIMDQDGKKITNKIYLDGKFIKDVVVDFGKEIITSNGEKVGFVKEIIENVGSVKKVDSDQPNNIIASVVDPGGGGTKTYIRTYTTGFYSTARDIVLLAMSTIAMMGVGAIATYFGVNLDKAGTFIVSALSIFIANNLSKIIPEKTYYVKVYDTGVVYNYGAPYRRALLEVYPDSSCSWNTYMGCEWADARVF